MTVTYLFNTYLSTDEVFNQNLVCKIIFERISILHITTKNVSSLINLVKKIM